MVGTPPVKHILKFAMHALDYCSQIVLNFIKIHPVHEDVSHLQKYFFTPSAFLCSTPCCPFTSHQAWDFCDTFGEFTHTDLFQATQQQRRKRTQNLWALMPYESTLSCPLPGVCTHVYSLTHPQEGCQSMRFSTAAHPSTHCQGHTLLISVLKALWL